MKKIYLLGLMAIGFAASSHAQTAFGAGNIVVYKVGDGTNPLSSAPFPVSLDEYTSGGTFVQSHPMPIAVSGSNKRLVASGSASSEGQMTRSADRQYLLVPGYDTFPDPTRASIVNAPASVVNRVVGVVSYNGTADISTALTDAFSANNFRGATSSDGNSIWLSGTGSPSSSASVRYCTKGATTSTQLSTAVTNIRTVNIFNNQLYCSSSSGAFVGVSAVGTGLPITSGQTIAALPGFPTSSGPSVYAFSIKPTNGNVLYVGSDLAIGAGGGIQKWTFNGTTWSLAYVLHNGITSGVRGLTVNWDAANPIIYAVTSESSANTIISVIDNTGDSTAPISILATAPTNYVFRGIAFAPENQLPVTLTNFNAVAAPNSVELNWATSQEINSKEFIIEKSGDGIHFAALNEYAAAGNSNLPISYKGIDANPATGINYYRLKTINKDGTFSYSNIVKIKFAGNIFAIYPNPAKSFVTIQHATSTHAILTITDMQGRTVQSLNINAGSTFNEVNTSNLSKGQYLLKYTDNNNAITHILSKQ